MLVLVLVATLLSASLSCQNMRLMALDKSVVVGRTLEFSEVPVDGAGNFLVTEQAGTTHEMPKLPNCETPYSFSSDFKVVRFRVWFGTDWANTTLGGMNDEGLSVSTLYFTDFAKFKRPEQIKGAMCERAAVPQTKLATYILGKYSSVKTLKSDLKSRGFKFPIVWNQPDLGNPTIPVHYAIHDKEGNGLVLEYTKEGRTFFDNTVGAMTNAPDYAWHMENLKNYPNIQRGEWKGYEYRYKGKKYVHEPSWTGTGFTGIPGDYSSPSRFIKAATLVSHLNSVPDADGAVNKMFHLLNTADIPKGIISAGWHWKDKERVEFVDYTWWMGVYDLSRKCVYFRGYDDISIKKVCLADIPVETSKINVDGEYLDSYIDVSGKLVPMDE